MQIKILSNTSTVMKEQGDLYLWNSSSNWDNNQQPLEEVWRRLDWLPIWRKKEWIILFLVRFICFVVFLIISVIHFPYRSCLRVLRHVTNTENYTSWLEAELPTLLLFTESFYETALVGAIPYSSLICHIISTLNHQDSLTFIMNFCSLVDYFGS